MTENKLRPIKIRESLEKVFKELYLTDEAILSNYYANATINRTVNSFQTEKDEGRNLLHVNLREDSPVIEFANELSSPRKRTKLIGKLLERETSEEFTIYEVNGFARGIHSLFEQVDQDYTLFHTENVEYFVPSEPGISSKELLNIGLYEDTIPNLFALKAEEYIEEIWEEHEEKIWNRKWMHTRPIKPVYEELKEEKTQRNRYV